MQTSTNGYSQLSSQPSQTRQMYRFGVNDANTIYTTSASSGNLLNASNTSSSNSANTNGSLRTAIKRSVSQVPTTERRPPLSSAQSQTLNSNSASISPQNGFITPQTTNISNNHTDSLDSKVMNFLKNFNT